MDKALKQRLVGATVLIALAVIVLPMLLGGRPEGDSQVTEHIEIPPEPPELSFETRRYPIGDPAPETNEAPEDPVPTRLPAPKISGNDESVSQAGQDGDSADTDAMESDGLAAGEADGPDATPEETGYAETAPEAAEEPAAVAQTAQLDPSPEPSGGAGADGRYIVQVASFGAVANANRLTETLGELGYPVLTDSVSTDVGTLHRVRVGPFDSEAEAGRAASELERSIEGVKPRVMDLMPELAAQATVPADPLVRWVVQVGSFSSEANAENLVAALRLGGHSAYRETVTGSGNPVYRVRIGPFLQREEAVATEQGVRDKMSLKGVVMSAD